MAPDTVMTVTKTERQRGTAACGIAVAVAVCAALLPLGSQADDAAQQRLLELEQQLQILTGRVELLERRAAAPQPGVTAGLPADGVVWSFDDYVNGTQFKVSHKSLDKHSGRLDLLLQTMAPLADPDQWTDVGSTVPIALTLRSVDGAETHTTFTLGRGARLEPGAHLHLQATIDPLQAAAVRHLIIRGTAE